MSPNIGLVMAVFSGSLVSDSGSVLAGGTSTLCEAGLCSADTAGEFSEDEEPIDSWTTSFWPSLHSSRQPWDSLGCLGS